MTSRIIVAAILVLISATFAVTAAERPNIILAMADDQGWGDMAYSGHPHVKTPNFDALAKDGLRFDCFYAAAPVCSPTRGSVLTGRHPNRFGCFQWGHSLRPQEITIAEALKTAGYATGHFGKWHLGSVRKGSPVNPGASGFDVWLSAENFYDNNATLSREGVAVKTTGESSLLAVDAALEFIESCAKKQQPFLAVVWFGSPHVPHVADAEYRQLYQDLPPKQAEFLGEISGMDAAFGKLRGALGPLGIRDNTILWYCSDNGALPIGSSGGHRGQKGQIYDGGLLVPALVEWPAKIKAPRVTRVRCNTADIYPTLLDIVGVNVEGQTPLDGVSLKPLLEGELKTRPQPMGFWNFPEPGIGVASEGLMKSLLAAQQRGEDDGGDPSKLRLDAGEIKKPLSEHSDQFGHAAWIDGDWKLHRIGPKQTDAKEDRSKYELYNLKDDHAERRDLASAEPERVKAMKAALLAWQHSVIASHNGADYAAKTEP